jgi:ribosome-associated toxin RatA of RatAB toxin-antitoxin module
MRSSAERMFQLTTDIEQWPSLMPTVTSARRLDDRAFGVGSSALLKQPGQRPAVWTVTDFAPSHRFVWEAKVFGVRMTASHIIEPTDQGCRNQLLLDIEGRGSRLMGRLLGKRLRKVLATENECFRVAAERSSSQHVTTPGE